MGYRLRVGWAGGIPEGRGWETTGGVVEMVLNRGSEGCGSGVSWRERAPCYEDGLWMLWYGSGGGQRRDIERGLDGGS